MSWNTLSSACVGAAAFASFLFDSVSSQAVIGNDYVILGVDSFGSLNIPYVGNILNLPASDSTGINYIGLRNGIATRVDMDAGSAASTEPGCRCEGWGVGVDYLVGAVATYEESGANVDDYGNDNGFNLNLVSFTGNDGDDQAVSVVENSGGDLYQVTHDYHPSADCNEAFEVSVKIENISPYDFSNVKYRRVMDWDIYPTFFSEYVSIIGTATTDNLYYSDDNGFTSSLPSVASFPRVAGTVNVDFVDSGPSDHGALFDFQFGALASGESVEFRTFYGVSGNEEGAVSCLENVEAEVYSLGQQNADPDGGEPFTFFFAFADVGGTSIGCSLFTCPAEDTLCENSPCDCDNELSSDFDDHCIACHDNGCNQCESGYFKLDYDHSCALCSDYFGDGCLFCQDFNGCGQCASGYLRRYDETCGVWYCDDGSCDTLADTSATTCEDYANTPCENAPCGCGELEFCNENQCHDNGCSQCMNGYFKKDFNFPCINCQQVFGGACMFCQDFNGCGQCSAGYNRVYNEDCGLWECELIV